MSNQTKHPLDYMRAVGLSFMEQIIDVTDRMQFAGSIRRGKAEVGDIEIVCTPRYIGGQNALEHRLEQMLLRKQISKRLKADGSIAGWGQPGKESRLKFMWLIHRDDTWGNVLIPLDLFIVLPDRQWGPTLLIRTGPGEANEVLVTKQGVRNRNGHVGILPRTMQFQDGAIWEAGEKLDTPEEFDVYAALGMPYLPPAVRSVASYQHYADVSKMAEPPTGYWSRRNIPAEPQDVVESRWDGEVLRESDGVDIGEQLKLI